MHFIFFYACIKRIEISRHIQVISTQENNLTELHLNKNIFPFVKNHLLPWLDFVFDNLPGMASYFIAFRDTQTLDEHHSLEQIKQKIQFHVYQYYCQLRISNIFDIIVDFPERY